MIAENEKPPAANAGGGLFDARLESSECQASVPAVVMELIIRMAEIDAGWAMSGKGFELVRAKCMALIEVEQRVVFESSTARRAWGPHKSNPCYNFGSWPRFCTSL
jgi:hypothetical protein